MHENEISKKIIGATPLKNYNWKQRSCNVIDVHKILGPGLLESVYEEALCHEFNLRGIKFIRQQSVPIPYKGVKLDTVLRLDLLVEDKVIVDIKAKTRLSEIDKPKTKITYVFTT